MVGSETFFSNFMNGIIEGYCIFTSLIFIYWLRPFVRNRRAVYISVLLEWCTDCILRYADISSGLRLLISVSSVFIVGFLLYLLD